MPTLYDCWLPSSTRITAVHSSPGRCLLCSLTAKGIGTALVLWHKIAFLPFNDNPLHNQVTSAAVGIETLNSTIRLIWAFNFMAASSTRNHSWPRHSVVTSSGQSSMEAALCPEVGITAIAALKSGNGGQARGTFEQLPEMFLLGSMLDWQ